MDHCRKILCLLLCFSVLNGLWMPASAQEEVWEEIPAGLWGDADDAAMEEPLEEPEEEPVEAYEEEFAEEYEEIYEEPFEEETVSEPKPYDAVPLYFQTDYPDVYYGGDTLATSGCSMASLAMVATYLTGYEYLPDELARHFAYSGESNMARLEYGSDTLQLPYEKNTNWHTTLQALQEGKIAIALLSGESHFTQSQHFVVLTGLTEDGRILVNDPYEPNYDHWALQQGFLNGFTEDAIVCGFQGAWVYDPEDVPEDVKSNGKVLKPMVPADVPLYYQTDYPDVYYGEGTVATSGCSMTSLAMVATYLTGHEYLPDELARYFAYSGESNMARLEYGSEALQLPYEKNTNWHTTLQALQDGKLAIVLLSSESHFTQSQHFVVLTGLSENGKIMVNDPYAPNYEHWALQQGFRDGFTEDAIVCGFQGAWVYDPEKMPENVERYYEELPEPVDPAEVPLYFQNDYPNTRYAGGTVATSGCSVTSLAMVASYMTDHEYLPDELARYFGGRAENHMARIEMGSETLGIPYEKNTNWHVTLQALREGKVAIVLVDDKTPFTQSQHFLVLTGLTSDGKVRVHDSWETNYSNWALEDGFKNGFEPNMIMKGFQGAWVYDKSEMPEDYVPYYRPAPVRGASRYQGVKLTLEEEDLLAKLVWAEARGESAEGQQAVAEVVLNRLVSDGFANTLEAVIYGDGQFRSVPVLKDAEPWQAQYDAIEAALYGPNILPMDVVYFARWETNDNVWGQIGKHIFCYAE